MFTFSLHYHCVISLTLQNGLTVVDIANAGGHDDLHPLLSEYFQPPDPNLSPESPSVQTTVVPPQEIVQTSEPLQVSQVCNKYVSYIYVLISG